MNRLRALQWIAAVLALDLHLDPLPPLRARNRQPDWHVIAEVASQHRVSPSLYPLLHRHAKVINAPVEFMAYLEALWHMNAERNVRLKAQIREIVSALNASGIEPVLLKGIASLEGHLYPDDGMRVLGDLDIHVGTEALPAATAAMLSLGYAPAPSWADNREWLAQLHHSTPLLHPQRIAGVELHHRYVRHEKGTHMLDVLEHRFPSADALTFDDCDLPGCRYRLKDPHLRLAHNFIHQMIQDQGYWLGVLYLHQLNDGAKLVATYGHRLQWQCLHEAAEQAACQREWRAYIASLNQLFGLRIPTPYRGFEGDIWYIRACLQISVPGARTFNRQVYRALRLVLPQTLQRSLGWANPDPPSNQKV